MPRSRSRSRRRSRSRGRDDRGRREDDLAQRDDRKDERKDDWKKDDWKQDGWKQDDWKKDDWKKDDWKNNDWKKDGKDEWGLKKEDPKKDEPGKEEGKKIEPKKEEPKKDPEIDIVNIAIKQMPPEIRDRLMNLFAEGLLKEGDLDLRSVTVLASLNEGLQERVMTYMEGERIYVANARSKNGFLIAACDKAKTGCLDARGLGAIDPWRSALLAMTTPKQAMLDLADEKDWLDKHGSEPIKFHISLGDFEKEVGIGRLTVELPLTETSLAVKQKLATMGITSVPVNKMKLHHDSIGFLKDRHNFAYYNLVDGTELDLQTQTRAGVKRRKDHSVPLRRPKTYEKQKAIDDARKAEDAKKKAEQAALTDLKKPGGLLALQNPAFPKPGVPLSPAAFLASMQANGGMAGKLGLPGAQGLLNLPKPGMPGLPAALMPTGLGLGAMSLGLGLSTLGGALPGLGHGPLSAASPGLGHGALGATSPGLGLGGLKMPGGLGGILGGLSATGTIPAMTPPSMAPPSGLLGVGKAGSFPGLPGIPSFELPAFPKMPNFEMPKAAPGTMNLDSQFSSAPLSMISGSTGKSGGVPPIGATPKGGAPAP